MKSRERLGLEQIGLWQLQSIDPKVPRDEQFVAAKSLVDDGVIGHAGLSNVTVADIEAASKVFKVATVQNRYNLIDRSSEGVLNYCEEHGIGFIPWFPLAAGRLTEIPVGLSNKGSIVPSAQRRSRANSSADLSFSLSLDFLEGQMTVKNYSRLAG